MAIAETINPELVKSLKNPLNAYSAIPLPPGVGEIKRISHITNCLAKTSMFSTKPRYVKTIKTQFTTKNRDVQDRNVPPKAFNQKVKGLFLNSLLVKITSSPV